MTHAIGVSTWVWRSQLSDADLLDLAPRVRGWGFDIIELPVEELGGWDPVSTRALLDGLGLTATVCLVMSAGRELVDTDRATLARTQDYLRSVVDTAAAVGSSVIGGPAYASVGRTWRLGEVERRDAVARWVDALAPVAEHAGQAGVRIAVEPLNRYETSFLTTVAQVLDAIEPLPVQTVGVLLDSYHMNIEEQDLAAAVAAAGPRIAHVQASATDRGTPGRDHLDWVGFLEALDRAGYDGPLCIESFTPDPTSIATAASIWRPLASTQDALAVDGLAFLRGVAG